MYKILLIEDEESIRINLQELLETEGYKTLVANNGQVGVELALAHLPDLILCDIAMPELDGFAVLKALREEARTLTVPFIFLTANADDTNRRKGMTSGSEDYLTKPYRQQEVLKAITTQLAKRVVLEQQTENKLEELRNSLSLDLPHKFISPLGVILTNSRLLANGDNNLDAQHKLSLAQNIHEEAIHLKKLTQNFLLMMELQIIFTDLARVKALRNQTTDLPNEITKGVAIYKAGQANRRQDLQLHLQETEPVLAISSGYLAKIIEELMDNAFRYSLEDTPVSVFSSCAASNFILEITNVAKDMIDEQIQTIANFKQLDRAQYLQEGFGQGLALVSRLTKLHGGKIGIITTSGIYFRIKVELPLRSKTPLG